MGSNQSSLSDRNNIHARHGRLSSSHQRERNKNKKTLAPNVNSGRAYEHLACTNDNSARSSPSDVRSSLSTLKDVDRRKSPPPSVVCFPCFGCVGNDDELNSRGVPNPGQNNDSVALLRVSSKLSLRAVELEDENNFSPEKSVPCTDEAPSDESLGDVVRQISWTGNQKVEHVSDVDCAYRKVAASEAVASEVVVKGSGIPCEKPVQPEELDFDHDQTGNGRLFVVSKKHLSFPCGLFSYAKSKPIMKEGYSNRQLAVMPTREQIGGRANERVKEVDCMSNSTSYEDSGKASESESGLLSLEQGSNVCKAPIAKIDSLETTSIDSLNSDDLMVDTMGFSCTSFKELEGSGSRDPVYAESMNAVCRHQKLNNSVHTRHGSAKGKTPDRMRPSCSSVSEPKLNRRNPDAFDRNGTENAVDDVLASKGGNVTLRETADRIRRVKWTIPEIPGARERKRLSYPCTGAELPFLCFDNLRPTSLDLADVNRLSSTIHEMPEWSMAAGDECMVLDRETQDDLRNDIETCRALLLDLGVLISQDEINNSCYLDSKNNNLSNFSMEEMGKNSLQVAELRQDSASYEELAMENNELRTKLTSLQMLMMEQQKLINTLENKLTHLSSTREITSHSAVVDVHSTPLATSE